jgi:triphosphoribosyl-dephospho-CoA synthase
MMLTIAECVQLACVLEATARKPGNVHRFADFADLSYLDFVLSAAAISPVIAQAPERGVGPVVLDAIRATQRLVRSNSNLGIVLLLAPLAAVPRDRELRAGVIDVLGGLTIDDSRAVFEAIRLANPGGLGDAPEQDVRGEPTLPLRQVMALAADRDLVARQFANGFRDVFDIGVPELRHVSPLEPAVIRCYLRLLAANPDTHIARRCGHAEAADVSRRATDVLAGADVAAFDAWLRADGHRRNPGSTADLVAASLFVALREGIITLPVQFSPR